MRQRLLTRREAIANFAGKADRLKVLLGQYRVSLGECLKKVKQIIQHNECAECVVLHNHQAIEKV